LENLESSIAVVTRKHPSSFKDTPPRKEKFYKTREALAKEGYGYWITWVLYSFDEEERKTRIQNLSYTC
jgi:hypothetical protein